ncbi:MAG: helix-turn-helix transcriptional regulator [Phycisphaerales bacterium]|nr:helix-turn-helix transcriptional regulator [Phycisphaerales bacterium]
MKKPPLDQTRFGDAVRRLRLRRGLSQETLASQAKCHRTYIGGVERGERNPTLTVILRIARALGCSPPELLEEMNRQE